MKEGIVEAGARPANADAERHRGRRSGTVGVQSDGGTGLNFETGKSAGDAESNTSVVVTNPNDEAMTDVR